MFPSLKIIVGFTLLLLGGPALSETWICPDADHANDERIKFLITKEDSDEYELEIRVPILAGHDEVSAVIMFLLDDGEAASTGAALALLEGKGFLYSTAGFKVSGQDLKIIVEVSYSDSQPCSPVLRNIWKHNQSNKAQPAAAGTH
jgi:hypothetical protein